MTPSGFCAANAAPLTATSTVTALLRGTSTYCPFSIAGFYGSYVLPPPVISSEPLSVIEYDSTV